MDPDQISQTRKQPTLNLSSQSSTPLVQVSLKADLASKRRSNGDTGSIAGTEFYPNHVDSSVTFVSSVTTQ